MLWLQPAQSNSTHDRAQELLSVVALPDAKDRRTQALRLSGAKDTPLEEWIRIVELTASLRPSGMDPGPTGPEGEKKPRPTAGVEHWHPSLFVTGGREETEISTFVPSSLDSSHPAPLLMAFHGTGGSGEDVEATLRTAARRTRLIRHGTHQAEENACDAR